MAIDTKSKISDYVTRENIKLEMLSIFMEIAGDSNIVLTNAEKSFILEQTDELVELYDVAVHYRLAEINNEEGELQFTTVPLEDVEVLVKAFRKSIAKMIFHIIKKGLKYECA